MANKKTKTNENKPDEAVAKSEEGTDIQDKNMEQMKRRQSAPQPTVYDYLQKNMTQQAVTAPNTIQTNDQATISGYAVFKEVIGKEQLHKATDILQKYKEGKANLEQRIIENEQWYKLRHWEHLPDKREDVEPTSAWLFNSIANKHADAMDNFPSPNILPREEGDKEEAERLTSIIPVILDQNNFEQVYSDVWDYKLKSGTGVYGIFWDKDKLNGLGDVAIEDIDLINLFWEPGITDIQKSRHLFHTALVDNEELQSVYPQLLGKLSTPTINVAKYLFDDSVDTTDKSVVVDWYYHTYSNGRKVLQFCKYCNDVVLYATENDPRYRERGWYDDGKYPFVFDPLFRVKGTPAGFGYIDIGKNPQSYIDRGNKAIEKSLLANAAPRYFINSNGSVNEEEYADFNKELVHVDGNLGQDSILQIPTSPLNNIYVTVLNNKIDELKETTGNRDISTGGTTSGVTAASAIAAMQEAGSKLSRDNSKASYRAYKQIVLMVIERIRQFYDLPRCFRIMGENGVRKFVEYNNSQIVPQMQPISFGEDPSFRTPLFDVEVSAEKQSPYSKMAQNELALQFYQAGFFNPQMADQALACLDMMDFDRKDFIMNKISQNGTMMQMIMQLQQQMMALGSIVDADRGSAEVTSSLANQFGATTPGGVTEPTVNNKSKLSNGEAESPVTQKARQRVADSTVPR